MFAIPGIAALIVFILARPQEFFTLLQRVPFLHLFTALAVVGWVIDVRLRRTQPIGTPGLPWAVAFLGWCVVTVAIVTPDVLLTKAVEMAILFALYFTIAHGVQKFRTLQVVAAVMTVTCLFISAVCLHQGYSAKQCVGGQELEGEINGVPDGRVCEKVDTCYGPESEPGLEYRCEHVGAFGTYSVDERVRYRGELQDPNEVALAIAAGALSLLIAFVRRARNPVLKALLVGGIAVVVLTVIETKSRGGQLSVALVFGVYFVRRFGVLALLPAAALGAALLAFGGRSDANADISTQLRYEAWATGLQMFRESPIYGVGAGAFGDHHFLTAHNSFVLALGELGFPGLVLFVAMVYISVKSLVVGLRDLSRVPGAEVVQVWGMALLASFAAILFQINTLSFAYKSVLWIFFGLVGAWTGAIRHHRPEFTVRLTWKDLGIIVFACVVYVFGVLPVFLRYKGEM